MKRSRLACFGGIGWLLAATWAMAQTPPAPVPPPPAQPAASERPGDASKDPTEPPPKISIDLKKRDLDVGSMKFYTARMFDVQPAQVISSDVFALVSDARVAGRIKGDLILAGGQLLIDGTVDDDLQVAGSAVTITGTIGDDLRSLGANLRVSGQVAGDALLTGGRVIIDSGAHVTGSMLVKAGEADVDGRIDGPLRVEAGRVGVNGTINGDVTVICDELTIGPETKIAGNLTYSARREAHIDPGTVAGNVERKADDEQVEATGDKPDADKFSPGSFVFFHVYLPMVAMVSGVLLVVFFGRFVNATLGQTTTGPGLGISFGIGFVALLVMLFVGVACLCLFPLALAVWSALGALVYFGGVIGKMVVGRWALRPLLKRGAHPVLALLVGVVLIELVSFIPVLGKLAFLAATFTGVGAALMQLRSVRQGDEIEGMPQLP